MTVTQTTSNHGQPGNLRCTRCKTILPIHATFCGSCGARVDRSAKSPPLRTKTNVVERYRITSLIRRRPHVQLFLALDNQQKRPVVIRDITISDLDEDTRAQVIEASRKEFELLRSQPIPDVTPVIDLRTFHDHFFLISGWPFKISKQYRGKINTRSYTLQDLLQSGIGLPEEQVAVSWTHRLCHALARLHQQQIVIGDLDPHVIVVSNNHYHGQPALTVSWLPFSIRGFLPKTSTAANAAHFTAPEALLGDVEPRSDIYSLGAILYLLLTGSAPEQPTLNPQLPLRTPREMNPRISSAIDTVVMRALSTERTDRYQSADEMSDILLGLCSTTTTGRSGYSSSSTPKYTKKLTSNPVTTDVPFASSNTRASEEGPFNDDIDDVTISIVPLQAQLVRWHMSKLETNRLDANEQANSLTSETAEALLPSSDAEVAEPSLPTSATEEVETCPQLPDTEDVETSAASDAEKAETATDAQSILNTSTDEDLSPQTTSAEEEETIHIAPLRADSPKQEQENDATEVPTSAPTNDATHEPVHAQPSDSDVMVKPAPESQNAEVPSPEDEDEQVDEALPEPLPRSTQLPIRAQAAEQRTHASQGIKERIAGTFPWLLPTKLAGAAAPQSADDSLLKRVQRFILGEQHHSTAAAALIETPLRIQPNQSYSIRIHLMGRDEPRKGVPLAGLSALLQGETVRIEVRSALYQNYAYIVQQADVQIPSRGYAAEVTMPMQPLSTGPSGRRERLHIFFMDEMRRPLYEKPFVIELFISHLVQAGREGHNVLTIPQ